ncbi:transposase [Pseudomonas qingdaonensis]|uniref:Transposase n=1 Tax=Pseudomonas qingdaonensis TaxID=2056231 RepID=A0ABX8DZN4_9PSED|nr:transposase [Pseudomonas qingdaonensis]
MLLDETQFINTGLAAAKITDILLTLASIGPPAVYVCNYSLVHKLFGRNSEDKQRLLSQPRIMLPDLPGSKDWTDYVDECVRVSGDAVRPGLADFAAELYRCTFGIKRLAVQLLKQAYIECRNDRRHWIELRDLCSAYRSVAYTSNASEVEELQTQTLGNRQSKQRLDLKCPFELPAAYRSNVVEFARAEREQGVIAKVFDSSLTESERSAKKHLEEAAEIVVKKPSRRPAAKTLSKDEEAKAFFERLDLASKPRRPKSPS